MRNCLIIGKSTVVPTHKKGDKTDCSNYRGTSLRSTSYKILKSTIVSRLTPYTDEITGDHQCVIRRNELFANANDVSIEEESRHHK
jgi:hypothetical protein